MEEEQKTKNKKIQVMIENYDRKSKVYELGKQEIVDLNKDEINEILQDLPVAYGRYSKIYLPIVELHHLCPRLIINYHSIQRRVKDNQLIAYQYHHYYENSLYIFYKQYFYKQSFFIKPKYNETTQKNEFDLPVRIPKKLIFLLDRHTVFSLLLLIYFIFLSDIIFLNPYFTVFSFWFLLLAVSNVLHTIFYHSKLRKTLDKEIEYTTPIISHIKTLNLSWAIIVFIVCYGSAFIPILAMFLFNYQYKYWFITDVDEYGNWWNTIFLIVILVYIVVVSLFLIYVLLKYFLLISYAREQKNLTIVELNDHLQTWDLDWNAKQFYLQLIFELENKPVTSLGLFPKLVTVLTFILSVIPLLL